MITADRAFFIAFCLLPFFTLLVIPHLPFDPFNASRILEVGMVCIYLVWMVLGPGPIVLPVFSIYTRSLLGVLIVLVLFSTVYAECLPLAMLSALENFILVAVVVLLAGNSLGFEWCLKCCVAINAVVLGAYEFSVIVGYVAGLQQNSSIDYQVLIYGVTNFRFFNQYQVWVTPLLFFAGVSVQLHRGRLVTQGIWLVVCLSWSLLFFSSARGAVLSLVATIIPFLILGNKRIKRACVQYLFCAIVGFFVFFVMYYLLPKMFLDVQATNVIRSTDSGRWAIWGYSVELWLSNPWLGVGPANFVTSEAPWFIAHPHNFLFQALSEWGGPAVFITMLLLSRYFYWVVSRLASLKQNDCPDSNATSLAILLVGVGVVIYSMLDGVHIMPLSQMTGVAILAVTVKYALGLAKADIVGLKNVLIRGWMLACVLLWLPVVGFTYAMIPDEFTVNTGPRFWVSGFLVESCCVATTPPASTNPLLDNP